MRSLLAVACLVCGGLWSGCASLHYAKIKPGKIEGRATIEWIAADQFIYRPDAADPMRFTRANGEKIQPELMYTDGGSIPRPLWIFANYSPWGYGPAYLIHDWLFAAHRNKVQGYGGYTLDGAADVMSECIRTLIEQGKKVPKNKLAILTIDQAVRSSFAKGIWESGPCPVPSAVTVRSFVLNSPYVQRFDFSK